MKVTSYSKLSIAALAVISLLFAGCGNKDIEADDNKPSTSAVSTSTSGTASEVKQLAPKPSENSVYFAFNSSTIDASAQATLNGYANWLNDHGKEIAITIQGNCDQRGSREYNHALGQQRADSIRTYLGSQGVDISRVDTVSFGEEQLVCTGTGEACWAQNRRADIVTR